MSKLFFSGVNNVSNIQTDDQVTNNINAYWNSEEITFPIHRKILAKMKESSNLETKLVCLEVHNIESKDSVIAYWKPFNNDTIEISPTVSYYVLSEELLKTLTLIEEYPIVVARIFQTPTNPITFGVFCHKARLDYKPEGGIGSDPVTSNSSGAHL